MQFHEILDHGSIKKIFFSIFSFLFWLILSKQIADVLKMLMI